MGLCLQDVLILHAFTNASISQTPAVPLSLPRSFRSCTVAKVVASPLLPLSLLLLLPSVHVLLSSSSSRSIVSLNSHRTATMEPRCAWGAAAGEVVGETALGHPKNCQWMHGVTSCAHGVSLCTTLPDTSSPTLTPLSVQKSRGGRVGGATSALTSTSGFTSDTSIFIACVMVMVVVIILLYCIANVMPTGDDHACAKV